MIKIQDLLFAIHAIMFAKSNNIPVSWLAFELNILRRLKFDSIIMPFTGNPNLGAYLKRLNVRVLANDPTLSEWTKAVAVIENNSEKLSLEDIDSVLKEAYVPHYQLQNPALGNWFYETDAWWFDNVRANIEKLASPLTRAIALSAGIGVGDYVLSFDEETRELRRPLSEVFRRFCSIQPEPFDNGQKNACYNKTADDFIAENSANLMFLRLPTMQNRRRSINSGIFAWREEWLRRRNDFWEEAERTQAGKLGAAAETKHQYLRFVAETLRTASHIRSWAIAHTEDGFVSAQDLVEIVAQVRRVDTVFTKDFSELSGAKAVIITA